MSASVETVSVVVCAYSAQRRQALAEALESVRRQTRRPDQTIVVVDHNRDLLEHVRADFPELTVVPNRRAPGLSGARNTGVDHARSDIVAFLDDDASAEPTWLAELLTAYADRDVVGVGGLVRPRWVGCSRPGWMPEEFDWTFGCSYRGLPTRAAEIRNPIGANMSFRHDAIVQVGGFRDGMGRTASEPLGCEETELAIRVVKARPGARVVYVPGAAVDHRVEPERLTWRYFRSRCWAEGRSKAMVTRHVGGDGLASERAHVLKTLPAGVVRGAADALRGDVAGVLRAAAIVAGLAATVAGFVYERWAPRS